MRCTVINCVDKSFCEGYCSFHYNKHNGVSSVSDDILCSIADCNCEAWRKGLCNMHYMRQKRGQPLLGPNKRPRRTYEYRQEYLKNYRDLNKLLNK